MTFLVEAPVLFLLNTTIIGINLTITYDYIRKSNSNEKLTRKRELSMIKLNGRGVKVDLYKDGIILIGILAQYCLHFRGLH